MPVRLLLLCLLLLCLLPTTPAPATDFYVDNVLGNDKLDGMSPTVDGQTGPFASIASAVALVKPGDTVHLASTGRAYRQSLVINGLQGEVDRPIVFDGHGAWLTGADHLSPEQWVPSEEGPEGTLVLTGVQLDQPWWNTLCIDGQMLWGESNQDALATGEFYWWADQKTLYCRFSAELATATIEVGMADGTTVLLPPEAWGLTNFPKVPGLKRNRGLKAAPVWVKIAGQNAPLVDQPALDRLPPGRFYNNGKTFFYRPPEGRSIQEMRMMAVLRASGVALNGTNRHLIFKNFNTVYLGNDGYNIHGDSKEITFLNCNAFFTGDEGFSSHDHCDTILDGGLFLQCNSGIHNVNNCSTLIRNVIVDNSGLRNDRADTKSGIRPNEISNTILIGCGIGTTQTVMDNVLLVNGGMHLGVDVNARNVTILGVPLMVRVDSGASVTLDSCLFQQKDSVIHARMEDPAAALSFKRLWFDPTTAMEWGIRHPWTRQPLDAWLEAHPANAAGGNAIELGLAAALEAGEIPDELLAGMGCSRELLQRYLEFRPRHQALIREALDMAWGE